ncbi:RimJ/RimL family protein N-acetyltransferase [Paenibacillus taihuensis]|uniref:RimJ/RimL family protein N-acetyltransferase n=1 Tax=Paenibacillus taihuensis TaxID=1156355 RepID=A0A3D9SF31_9BACL|nr:GNAT family N-acetyltransferase [Paenibacillus taihuensis]REE94538.1 RimJ/RimL family protein N-acetyltransferase [Paenibacillus taihuensis]
MDPIMMDFPDEFHTERLWIRMPRPGDGRAAFEAVNASLDELKPWMKWAQNELSEYDAELGMRESHIKFLSREKLRFLVFLRSTGQFVAATSLHSIDWEVRKFEIGYWIDTRLSGNGYMLEAVRGLCEFAFNQLNARRLEIRCDTTNSKSIKIPERLQFELEGTFRADDVSADGTELRDTYLFAKLGFS